MIMKYDSHFSESDGIQTNKVLNLWFKLAIFKTLQGGPKKSL